MHLSILKSKKALLLLFFIIIAFIAIPVTVFLVKSQQLKNASAASSVSATVNGASSAVVSAGATINVSVTNTLTSSSTWTNSGYNIYQGSPGTYTCVDTADHTTNGNYTESFDITAPSTPGTYNINFVVSDGADCNSGTQSFATLQSGISVIVTNPALPQACGIDIALVLDNSNSINSTQLGQMKTAVKTFVDSFSGTSTQFSVTRFASSATILQQLTSNLTDVDSAIDAVPQNGGFTNWEDGLIKSSSTLTGSRPKFIIVATDGDPTASTAGPNNASQPNVHLAPAVTQANTIKTGGTRILAIGIGASPTLLRLEAISGTNINTGDVQTSDVITANFSTLATQLASLAQDACGGTLTILKSIDGVTPPDSSLAGWYFNVGTGSAVTDDTGQTQAIDLAQGSYSVTEDLNQSPSGYTFDNAACSNQNGNIATNNITNGVSGVTVNDSDIVSCTFNNNQEIADVSPTPTEIITPTPTNEPTPTQNPTPTQIPGTTATPTPTTDVNSTPTLTPTVTPGGVVAAAELSPTLPATGPSVPFVSFGIFGLIIVLIGGALLLTL